MLLALLVTGGKAAPGVTTVHVRLIDGDTGRPAPAMISITSAGGKVRLPPGGKVLEGPSTVDDFMKGVRFSRDPNWIGPVRNTARKYLASDREGRLSEFPPIPFWKEPVMFQASGDFSVELPAGGWRIAAKRGNEFIPVAEEFTLEGEGAITKTLLLERWINLANRGWWSGDVHVHHPTLAPENREFLLAYAKASDIHVANLLEMGHHWPGNAFRQAGFGKKFRVNSGDYWLVSGQEDPRGIFDHISGLNITRMVRDLTTYDWYDVTFRGIHAQPGALVGFPHFVDPRAIDRGFPWFVTTGEIDFVELLQFGRMNPPDYYDYLNLGFKLTAAAGSDVPYGATMGEVRTYVQTGPKLDVDAWFEGLKKGNTFVSNGPALEFTVNGKLPGSEIAATGSAKVTIEAHARSHPAIGTLKSLRIVGNDGVIAEIGNPEGKDALDVSLERKILKSQWIVAAAACDNGAVAHSTPVYVTVDGRPHWSREKGPAIIAAQLEVLEKIRGKFSYSPMDERGRGMLDRLRNAEKFYQDLLAKMKKPDRRAGPTEGPPRSSPPARAAAD